MINEPQLLDLLRDLTDRDPCRYDHHGYCQAHGWMATEPRCPHARAKELLKQADEASRYATIRYRDGVKVRLRGWHLDSVHGDAVVTGEVVPDSPCPRVGEAVSLSELGLPGRGHVADSDARIEAEGEAPLFETLDAFLPGRDAAVAESHRRYRERLVEWIGRQA